MLTGVTDHCPIRGVLLR